jgi:two-component system probable response regulator PhcQ
MQPKVLLVDDDARVTEALQRVLSQEGYEISSAQSAEEALDILRQQSVDVIVSDEQMPGLSGSEFLTIVRHSYPDIVRIILTGQASLEAAMRAINKGEVYRFLTKPCNRQDLTTAIEYGLEQKDRGAGLPESGTGGNRSSALREELESDAPGITRLTRDSCGTIILEEGETDLETLVQTLKLVATERAERVRGMM